MKTITFSVPVVPIPKGRPRFANGRTYTPKRTHDYEQKISNHARQAMGASSPLEGRLKLWAEFYMPIPKTWRKSKRADALAGLLDHLIVGDVDNLTKAASDAMNGVVYHDDRQIVAISARKRYGAYPEAIIKVEEV